jgi:hypothetical protein
MEDFRCAIQCCVNVKVIGTDVLETDEIPSGSECVNSRENFDCCPLRQDYKYGSKSFLNLVLVSDCGYYL